MDKRLRHFWGEHNLSIVTGGIIAALLIAYSLSHEQNHLTTFFGNAIADWSGVLLMVLGSKFLMERGSKESQQKRPVREPSRPLRFLKNHSFTIFVLVTLAGWAILFSHEEINGKWGQVVGNIVSEWTQALGMIQLTKSLRERGSEESK